MFTFEIFREEVITCYKEKKQQHKLYSQLENPSPGNLRNLCLIIFSNGLSKEDTQTFNEFFNPLNQSNELETSINRFDLDKLRPLRNFILGKAKNPKDEVVKLLAILVDFQPRPYENWKKSNSTTVIENDNVESGEKDSSEIEAEIPVNTEQAITALNDANSLKSNSKSKYLVVTLGLVLLLGVFLFIKYGTLQKQCMYWNNDRYIAVDCKEKIPGSEVIALDEHKLNNFRRITRPDTLSNKDVSRVWYSKVNNSVEFFTEPGHHPLYDKPLKAVTAYILNQHALEIKN
ncbi:hypothetical protein [Sphingobacterium hungaricum]|uniref:Uncharacterized protein n=1 Tax=Sphingobacterium hungaricum TaxID=2082723 RepID=A0A928YNZ7_9SPHI|nr:hypothetical protein [Sphingobacterium hungaricum]MBE8712394.1 hypothetical protein [Sphingobacterium hungaricum]